MRIGGAFSRLLTEFGGVTEILREKQEVEEEDAIEAVAKEEVQDETLVRLNRKHMGKAAGTGRLEGRLMVSEKRKTGSVGRKGMSDLERPSDIGSLRRVSQSWESPIYLSPDIALRRYHAGRASHVDSLVDLLANEQV